MSLMTVLRLSTLLCIACVLMTSSVSGRHRRRVEEHGERHVTGVAGQSVVLRCDLPVSTRPRSSVRWIDFVYNTSPEPELISSGRRVQRTHPNADKFRVDSEFSLTISSLTVDESPGEYVCQSDVDGRTHALVYQLTVFNMPRCSGVSHVSVGDVTSLVCESTYSGNEQPQLDWYRHVHQRHRLFDDEALPPTVSPHGHRVHSEDEFLLRESGPVARQVVRLPVHHSDDGAVYTCQMTLADMVQQCNVTLNVTYLVKGVKFRPRHNDVAVGDEIKCHARGNPTPRIRIDPAMTSEVEGPGWKSFRVPGQYEGQDMTVVCAASNTVGDDSETMSRNRTFHVAERSPDKHGHVNPNEHPPMHDSSSLQDNSGETWRRVEQKIVVVASLISLVMLQ